MNYQQLLRERGREAQRNEHGCVRSEGKKRATARVSNKISAIPRHRLPRNNETFPSSDTTSTRYGRYVRLCLRQHPSRIVAFPFFLPPHLSSLLHAARPPTIPHDPPPTHLKRFFHSDSRHSRSERGSCDGGYTAMQSSLLSSSQESNASR